MPLKKSRFLETKIHQPPLFGGDFAIPPIISVPFTNSPQQKSNFLEADLIRHNTFSNVSFTTGSWIVAKSMCDVLGLL